MTDSTREEAIQAFRAEIQAIHEQYKREGGTTPRFQRILENSSIQEAIEDAIYRPTPMAYKAHRTCFDRARAAGMRLAKAIGLEVE